jgi:hypothetical protein
VWNALPLPASALGPNLLLSYKLWCIISDLEEAFPDISGQFLCRLPWAEHFAALLFLAQTDMVLYLFACFLH